MKISFYLHNRLRDGTWTIYMRYAHNSKLCRFSMKEAIPKENWREKKQQTATKSTNPDAQANIDYINEKLEVWKQRITRIAREYKRAHGDFPPPAYIIDYVKHGEKKKTLSFWDAWEHYQTNYLAERSEGTRVVYTTWSKGLRQFELYRGRSVQSEDINYPFVLEYIQYLRSEGNGDNTINQKLSKLRQLVRYANKLPGMPIIDLANLEHKSYKVKEPLKVYLTDDEFWQLWQSEQYGIYEVSRDLWVLQEELGCRYSELAEMKFNGGVVSFTTPKTDKDISLPLSPIAKFILEKYEYQIPEITSGAQRERIKIVAKRAGINSLIFHDGQQYQKWEKLNTHAARRTWGNRAYKRGVKLASIQAWFGHSQLKQTMKYLDLGGQAQDDLIRDALG